MVLRELRTDALEGLATYEQLELLNSIDSLRSQGISHYVSLPQIIVCGDQSSGKSSVLEAISGVSFPVLSSLCTRFPTELVLRKHPSSGVRVSIAAHQSRSEMDQKRLGNFCEVLNSFEGLPNLIEKAKAVMGISEHGNAFSNDLLRVEISGPDRPHLTIVDLPGLIHSETKLQSATDVQLVQDVVQSYMREERSIILAVVSAKNDFANQIVLRLARGADPAGNRTLGVITKPDTLVAGSESEAMFLSLANNQEVEFRLGWHVLKNMDSEKGHWTLESRSKEERGFFSQGAWSDMPQSVVGVDALRSRLSQLLLRQIASELPSLIDEIDSKRRECQNRLEKLGEPRTSETEQRSYLLHIGQSFQSIVRAAIDGTYNEPFFEDAQSAAGYQKRLRAVVQNLNEEFAEEIARHGEYRRICSSRDEKPAPEGQLLVSREKYTSHIEHLLKKTRGRELPGTFNPMIVRELFLEQCSPWERLTTNHITAVWEATQKFLQVAAEYVADEATAKLLVNEAITPSLESLRRTLEARTKELLLPHQRGHPITYNQGFTLTLQKIRAERRESELGDILRDFFGMADLEQPYYSDSNIYPMQLLRNLLKSTEPDMNRFSSSEALNCMLSYYKVALERFVDDIANEVVEGKLLLALSTILSPVAVFEMPSELVTRIAGESKENQSLRDQLNRKLQILNTGFATCKRFVGMRAFGSRMEPRDESQDVVEPHELVETEADSMARGSSPSPTSEFDDYCLTPEESPSCEVEETERTVVGDEQEVILRKGKLKKNKRRSMRD